MIDVVNSGSDDQLEAKQTVLSNLNDELVTLETKEANLSERLALINDPTPIISLINETQVKISDTKDRVAFIRSEIVELRGERKLGYPVIGCIDR